MSTNKIIFQTIIPDESLQKILKQSENMQDYLGVTEFLSREFQIDITADKDIINKSGVSILSNSHCLLNYFPINN